MSIEFKFIGWCNETDYDGSKHDKIWGYFVNTDELNSANRNWRTPCYTFWGARDKLNTLKFKKTQIDYDLEKLRDQKRNKKHYRSISKEKLLEIWPDFYDQMEMKLTFAVLANKVM